MKLTRSASYALVAVGHIARTHPPDPVLAKSIAKQHKIPLDYLLKILQQLVRADVLRSIRGPRGGFLLARSVSRISLLQIIEAVDGPFIGEPTLCTAHSDTPYNRRVTTVYQQASKLAAKTLAQANIATLIGEKKQTAPKKTAKKAKPKKAAKKAKTKKTAKTKKKKNRR